MADARRLELNRELLRTAGEHLGALANQQREACDLTHARSPDWKKKWERYAALEVLSRRVLEIANG